MERKREAIDQADVVTEMIAGHVPMQESNLEATNA